VAITSLFPYVALLAYFIGLGRVIGPRDCKSGSKYEVQLESLRGLLASAVFVCHSVITYFYFQTGKWDPPPSSSYLATGSASVVLFFLLSGYLFWTKCISDGGVKKASAFYWARVRRVVPAYYVSVSLVVFIILAKTGFVLQVKPFVFLSEMTGWLTFGIPGLLPPLNGQTYAPVVNASVVWTLRLEIVFYLLLPLLYRFFKNGRVFVLVAILAFTYWRLDRVAQATAGAPSLALTIELYLSKFFAFGFGFGMIIAHVKARFNPGLLKTLVGHRWTALSVILLALPIVIHVPDYSPWEFGLLAVPFLCITCGNDLFGLLVNRGLLYLGKISYSFYITHGIVLFVFSHLLNTRVPFQTLRPWQFWLFTTVSGTAAVYLAAFLYENVERPFMKRRSSRTSSMPEVVPMAA